MAFAPTTWREGLDPFITAAELNRMEAGILEALLSGGHTVKDEGVALPQRTSLDFTGGGVTLIDDAGGDRTRVDIPQISRSETVPACRVRGSGQSIANGLAGTVTLLFTVEDFDTDNMHDNAVNTSRIVANTPGVYDCFAHVQWPTAGGNRYLYIDRYNAAGTFQENVAIETHGPSTAAFHSIDVAAQTKMSAGDYLIVSVLQDSGAPLAITNQYAGAVWMGGPGNAVDQPGVSAVKGRMTANSASQVWAGNTPLAFNDEWFDTDGMHDTVTNNSRFYAKTPGLYHVVANIAYTNVASAGVTRGGSIRKNGTGTVAYRYAPGSTINSNRSTMSAFVQLAAGDYLEFLPESGGDTAVLEGSAANEYSTTFSMVRIGSGKQVIPRARIARTTAYNAAQSWAKIPLDGVVGGMNNDGMFDAANGRLVCRTAGAYGLEGNVSLGAGAGGVRAAAILVNNKMVVRAQSEHSGANWSAPLATSYDLAVGDTVELWAYQSQTGGGVLPVMVTDIAAAGLPTEFQNWLTATKIGQSGPGANNDPGWATNGTNLDATVSGDVRHPSGKLIGRAPYAASVFSPGVYRCNGSVQLSNPGVSAYYLALTVNVAHGGTPGFTYYIDTRLNAAPDFLGGTRDLLLNAGDWLELFIWATANAAGALAVANNRNSTLQASLLGTAV